MYLTRNAFFVILVLVLAAIGGGAWLYFGRTPAAPMAALPDTPEEVTTKSYQNSERGIAFQYPVGYVLTEKEVGGAERGHYAITLIRAKDTTIPEGGEGPTSITLDLYQNNLDTQTLLGWLKGSSLSNFKLGPGTYASSSVAGTEAVTYRWSGLYEGETTAFIHGDSIVAVSVTFSSPDDAHLTAYRALLASLRFPGTPSLQ